MDVLSALRRRPYLLRRGLPHHALLFPRTFDSPRVLAGLTTAVIAVTITAEDFLPAAPLQRAKQESSPFSPLVPAALFARYARTIYLSLPSMHECPLCVGRGSPMHHYRGTSLYF